MKTFLVEREIGTTSAADLMCMTAANLRVAGQMLEEGDRIYYLGSTYIPDDGLCLCLFTAKNAEVVGRHSDVARLPVRRISDAVMLSGMNPAVSVCTSAMSQRSDVW